MSRFGILSLLIVGIVFLAIPSFGFQTEYFLYTSTGEEYTLPVLKILPTGQIVTTGLLYPADQTPSFGLLSDRRILLVANPSVSYQGFASYKINADYSLTLLSASTSTTHAFYILHIFQIDTWYPKSEKLDRLHMIQDHSYNRC